MQDDPAPDQDLRPEFRQRGVPFCWQHLVNDQLIIGESLHQVFAQKAEGICPRTERDSTEIFFFPNSSSSRLVVQSGPSTTRHGNDSEYESTAHQVAEEHCLSKVTIPLQCVCPNMQCIDACTILDLPDDDIASGESSLACTIRGLYICHPGCKREPTVETISLLL